MDGELQWPKKQKHVRIDRRSKMFCNDNSNGNGNGSGNDNKGNCNGNDNGNDYGN